MRRGILILGVAIVALGLLLQFTNVIQGDVIWIFIGIGVLLGLGSLIS